MDAHDQCVTILVFGSWGRDGRDRVVREGCVETGKGRQVVDVDLSSKALDQRAHHDEY
jgi:hypothetical protein